MRFFLVCLSLVFSSLALAAETVSTPEAQVVQGTRLMEELRSQTIVTHKKNNLRLFSDTNPKPVVKKDDSAIQENR